MAEPLDIRTFRREHAMAGQPVLRTMVVCDLADSTGLIDRLGDRQAAALIRKHDRMTRALVDEYEGREIDKTDGYLLLFERPTQAVTFALAYQRGLRYMSEAEEVLMRARVGIHVGDVMMWENTPEDIARGAKPVEVEGLAKPVAARLASLARPQQILLSGVAATIARRGQDEIEEDSADVVWKSYGRYRIRGVAELTEVVEVGEVDIAVFATPQNRAVANRILPWWRRPSFLVPLGLTLALAIGIATWFVTRPEPTLAFSARDWVVIADVQNETGQSNYDNTINTALRIGLQQSRYLNIISTAKVKQTLALMKLEDTTRVNARIGSEIALRDNASALIVPKIANYGNGLRVSAELVDPNTRRVIKSVGATADTGDDVVAAIDTLVRELRRNLGESLSQIKSTSRPLEQVTTSNLDALRAYSLASEASARGDFNLSINLLSHAIKLDPNFASAYAMQGIDYLTLGRTGPAKNAIKKALENSKRLSQFERAKLHAQAVSIYQSKVDATAAWKLLADLYPDDASGSHNAGIYYAAYLNDCDSAVPYLKHAASLPQSLQPVSLYALATCELTLGKVKSAIADFKSSYRKGFRGQFLALADAYVESRQYEKASAFLSNVPSDPDTIESLAVRRALVVADQGDLASAESNLRHGLQVITPDPSDPKGWAMRVDLVGVLWGQGKDRAALEETRKDLEALLRMSSESRQHLSFDYPTLVASYTRWAARLGDTRLAQRGINEVSKDNQLRGYPIRAQLISVAQAEIALREGHPERAVRIASAADSHPLWELLEVLARAKTAAGNPDAGDAYKRALDARSLAFGELYENELGVCTRAIEWNLAFLDYARSIRKENPGMASRQASIFLDHWHLAQRTLPVIKQAQGLVNAGDATEKPDRG